MMKMSKLYQLLAFPVLLSPAIAMAQADIHFSQFYENSILRNPALTGVFENDYKVGVTYRNQWSSILNPYQTAVITGEARFSVNAASNDYVSVGILGYYDKAGSVEQKIVGFYPALNYNKCMDIEHNTYLSAGFTAGYLQYSFNAAKATFNNQYVNGSYAATNPSGENLPNPSLNVYDLGAGVNFNTSAGANKNVTYIIGVSGYHFTQPKISYYQDPNIKMNMRWNVNAAMSDQASDNISFQIQANYALQGTYQEIIAGGLVGWNTVTSGASSVFVIYGGCFYRVGDAIIPMLKLKYKNMAFGYSYDVNVSTLRSATNLAGGSEITFYVTGAFRDRYAERSKTVCPRF
jgi:type IX secretion system PorP/SprF family membrane protein